MTELANANEAGGLWIPNRGMYLDDEYPEISPEALRSSWVDYTGTPNVENTDGVLGAISTEYFDKHGSQPKVFASVDICEILRETWMTLHRIQNPELARPTPDMDVYEYIVGLDYTEDKKDPWAILRVFMNAGLVPPVAGREEIAETMRNWRERGVYLFANTSTLPGCEAATVNDLKQNYPGCFDGIVFARDPYGKSNFTKGHAAERVIKGLSSCAVGELTTIHIDDQPHHCAAFRDKMFSYQETHSDQLGPRDDRQSISVKTFQPVYPSSKAPDVGSVLSPSPLESFRRADEYLKSR